VPIEFPLPKRGPSWTRPENLFSAAVLSAVNGAKQYVPNLFANDPGAPFKMNTFGGLVMADARSKNVNLRNLGTNFKAAISSAVINIENLPYKGEFVCDRELGSSPARSFIGVTRDSTGAILASATVYLMVQTNGLWTETQRVTSDASGNFRFDVMTDGPYWIPGYKSGAPDLAGASVNTLQPT
jgi:hypothetical protein